MRVLQLCFIFFLLSSCHADIDFTHWEKYNQLVTERFPDRKGKLNPGVSKETLIAFEEKFNIKLPEEFKQLYLMYNGEQEELEYNGYVCNLHFLSLEKVEEHLTFHRENIDEEFNAKWSSPIYPEQSVKKKFINSNWIPFISDLTGNYIAIDLDPDTNGEYGQVINFGADEGFHYVLGKNINSFFESVNKCILKQNFNQFNLPGHLTDALKKIIDKTKQENNVTD